MDKKTPFKIKESFFQEWSGGQPGVKGILVTLKIETPEKEVVFDSIYFQNKKAKLDTYNQSDFYLVTGNFMDKKTPVKDLILSSDPKEEFGNQLSSPSEKLPFNLKENQAIIKYIISDEVRYFLLKNLKKEAPIFYQ